MRLLIIYTLFYFNSLSAQCERWQQSVEYRMQIDFNVKNHRFDGKQDLYYTNNSPDTLTKVYYHLFFNAFQPGSAMDIRSLTIPDPDPTIGDRISKLDKSEIGYQKIISLKQNGIETKFNVDETILEVLLPKPIYPKQTCTLSMVFEAQVPIQIRRCGRDNKEGIDYTMTQWYPKLCAYDKDGWHANPYIAREFYGNWGLFDISISIDKEYMVAATGETSMYAGSPIPGSNKKLWHFTAEKVHDFAWAADRDFVHTSINLSKDLTIHFYYQNDPRYKESWQKLPDYVGKMFDYASKHYGKYPYRNFYVIQGGDRGMEYPMGTMITGLRSVASLVGVVAHEMMHSWYQGVLGFNESLYPWMDEGFATYASDNIKKVVLNPTVTDDPHESSYKNYFLYVKSGRQEPMTTHADHYITNTAYGINSYDKGCVFLHQLSYIIGQKALDKGLLEFYRDWSFKHPDVNDCVRSMEKASGIQLDWYKEYWINTTQTINYGIKSVNKKSGKYLIELVRIGNMPMPIDLVIYYKDGSSDCINIPIPFMRGNKPIENKTNNYIIEKEWQWPNESYMVEYKAKDDPIRIEIDPSKRMADTDRSNNVFELSE